MQTIHHQSYNRCAENQYQQLIYIRFLHEEQLYVITTALIVKLISKGI